MDDQSCKISRWQLLKAQLNNLNPLEFKQKIEATPDALIIDVRTKAEYESGHIQKAINLDYLSDDFWDQVEHLDNNLTVFVYCRTERRSIRVCTLMRNGGFQNEKLFNLEGGYSLWSEQFKL